MHHMHDRLYIQPSFRSVLIFGVLDLAKRGIPANPACYNMIVRNFPGACITTESNSETFTIAVFVLANLLS